MAKRKGNPIDEIKKLPGYVAWQAAEERVRELGSRRAEVERELQEATTAAGVRISGTGDGRMVSALNGQSQRSLAAWREHRAREARVRSLVEDAEVAIQDPTHDLVRLSDQIEDIEAAIEIARERAQDAKREAMKEASGPAREEYARRLGPVAVALEQLRDTVDDVLAHLEDLERIGLSVNVVGSGVDLRPFASRPQDNRLGLLLGRIDEIRGK